jgi:hypothetical protein
MDARLEYLLRLTAKLYYLDGLSQTQIGNLLGLSRPRVSCLLTRVSNEGIIHISVKEYEPRNAAFETEHKTLFNLNNAIVIRIVGALDIESEHTPDDHLAVAFLNLKDPRILENNKVVAGTTRHFAVTKDVIENWMGTEPHNPACARISVDHFAIELGKMTTGQQDIKTTLDNMAKAADDAATADS